MRQAFPNKEEREYLKKRAALRKRIRELFIDIVKSMATTYQGQFFGQYLDVLIPRGGIMDVGSLPYVGKKNGRASDQLRQYCMSALMSQLLIAFWTYHIHKDELVCTQVELLADKLEKIVPHYRTAKIIGNVKDGYTFEVPDE